MPNYTRAAPLDQWRFKKNKMGYLNKNGALAI